MFRDTLDAFIDQLVSNTLAYDDQELQLNISKLKKGLGNDFEFFFQHIIRFQTAHGIMADLTDQEYIKGIMTLLSHQVHDLKVLNGIYTFRVDLVGHENSCWREIAIPGSMSLADLGYMIQMAFGATGEHLFDISYRGETFICDSQDQYESFDEPYAVDVQIGLLKLRKNSHLDMTYDYGENWQFKIKVTGVHTVRRLTKDTDMAFGEGAGMNIWEDDHYDFDRYAYEPKAVSKEFEKNGWDISDFTDNVYDKDECNSDLLENFYNFKTGYEACEPNFFDEVEEDDFGPLN